MTESEVSQRLIDQRCRNRIMECLLSFADADNADLRRWGASEYFEGFYDWVPHRDHGGMLPNSALTPNERRLVAEVSSMVDDACDATPVDITADELIASGWPERIRPIARRVLDVMLQRGRFDEEREEQEPSSPVPWP